VGSPLPVEHCGGILPLEVSSHRLLERPPNSIAARVSFSFSHRGSDACSGAGRQILADLGYSCRS